MKKKIVKKYQNESIVVGAPRKTKLSVVSPSGDYRTTTKTKNTPNQYSESSKTRRTLRGVIAGAPKVNLTNPPLNNSAIPLTSPPSSSFMKKGGSKKTTPTKKKK